MDLARYSSLQTPSTWCFGHTVSNFAKTKTVILVKLQSDLRHSYIRFDGGFFELLSNNHDGPQWFIDTPTVVRKAELHTFCMYIFSMATCKIFHIKYRLCNSLFPTADFPSHHIILYHTVSCSFRSQGGGALIFYPEYISTQGNNPGTSTPGILAAKKQNFKYPSVHQKSCP